MGKKSDKKVKSERINALKKQYDAFLEEDKKRKERNEFILGRLDNMRYSSTAVQIRYKPIVYGDVMPIYNRGAYRPDQFERPDITPEPDLQINRPSHHNLQLDVQRNYLDNSSLLKEISKKYILIPKLRSSLVNDYVGTIAPHSLPPIAVSSPQPNINSNDDWKSKYDILEQLKKKEKEEHSGKYGNDELYPVKDKKSEDDTKVTNNFSPKQDIDGFKTPERSDDYALQNYNAQEFNTKYEQEVAEKDVTFNKMTVESEPQNIEQPKVSANNHVTTTDYALNSSSTTYTNPKANTVCDDYKLQNLNLKNRAPFEGVPANNVEQYVYDSNYPNENVVPSEYTAEDITNNSEHQLNEVPHQEVMYEQPIQIEGNFPDPKNAYLDPDEYSPIQVLDLSGVVKQIHNEPTEIKEDGVVEYPSEILNVQDYTPTEDVKLTDGVNVNPVYLASEDKTEPVYENDPHAETVVEQTVDPEISSGIEAFDAEQKEMFYAEETPEYTYDQQQSNEQPYEQDYANAPTQEYAYYESPATALQDQEYPAEVNEHEESNERYDQNYEQQYAAEYAQQEYQGQEQQQYVQPEGYDQTEQQHYVQPEGYDQTEQQHYVQPEGYDQTEQQQYVQPEGYDQSEQQQYEGYDQPERYTYEYKLPNLDAEQNIQQDLDNEAGYTDQQNAEVNKLETQGDPAAEVVDQNIA